MTRVRLPELDVVRALAALAVVLVHAAAATAEVSPAYWALNAVLRTGVPAFFFLTGAVVWAAQPSSRGIISRVARILMPYVAWSALYLHLRIERFGGEPLSTGPAFLPQALRSLLVGDAWYHLYFIPILLAIYALAPVARRLADRRPWLPFALTLGLAVVWGGLLPDLSALGGDASAFSNALVRYAPYAAAGLWYARRRDAALWALSRSWPVLLGVGIMARAAEALAPLPAVSWMRAPTIAAALALVFGVVGGARALLIARPEAHRPLASLARWSFPLYLAHPAAMAVLHRYVLQHYPSGLWAEPGMIAVKFAVGLSVALAIALAAERWRAATRPAR